MMVPGISARPPAGSRIAGDGPATAPALLAHRAAEQAAQQAAPQLGAAPRGGRESRRLPGFGRPLTPAVRAAEEARLGVDLSAVRLHDDDAAQAALDETGARAFACGTQIAMRRTDARDAGLLGHELAHVAQQARPGAGTAVQRQEAPARGIGRTPPDAPFVALPMPGAEDAHVLFDHDSASLSAEARRRIATVTAGRAGPLTVRLHGYASLEGPDSYNRNLAAHRAVAARDALRPLLPEGTEFLLVTHGETDAFGEPGDNRRVGIDFGAPEEGRLTLRRPGRARRFTLLEPGALELLSPPALTMPDLSQTRDAVGPESWRAPDPQGAPVHGPLRPTAPALAPVTPPPLFTNPYDFGAVVPDFALRGVPLTPDYAADIEAHFEFWRLRFFQLGLSPDLAEWAAQFGTDFMVGTHLSLQAPTQFEEFDRRHGTEPTTFTILDETRMLWIFEQTRKLFGGSR